MARRSSLAPSQLSTSRQSSLAYKGCSDSMNDAALQFKLSKKVAELTLVVHMLFTRNHEREVELEATKEAYEREIDGVTAHFEREISRLKTDLEMEKWRHAEALEKANKEGDHHTKKLLERHEKRFSELSSENDELKETMKATEDKLKKLTSDYALLQREFNCLNKEKVEKERAMEKDHSRIEKLQQNARANKELMDKMKDNIHSIQKGVSQKITQLETNSLVATDLADSLRLQNDNLETENKTLRKRLSDQGDKLKRLEGQSVSSNTSSKPRVVPKSAETEVSKDDEVERLKRELQKYRLELANREDNFNKIFGDVQPVMLRAGQACAREIQRSESKSRSNEIPIYSYKRTGHTRSTMRLRARSQLPSLRAVPDAAADGPGPSLRGAAPDGPTTSLCATPDRAATCASVSTCAVTSLPRSFLPSAPGELGKSSPPSEGGTSRGSTRGSQKRRTPLAIGAGFSVVPRLLTTESDTS